MSLSNIAPTPANDLVPSPDARATMMAHAANELIFAVVGHVGSGTSTVANQLKELLSNPALPGGQFDVEMLKARDEIEAWAKKNQKTLPPAGSNDINSTIRFQDLGDEMRQSDPSAIAAALVRQVRVRRAGKTGASADSALPVRPNGVRRAYIIDSLRNPAEVDLLRHIYQDAFVLVGVVCDEEVRRGRLVQKYANAGNVTAEQFMLRDAKATIKHGQRVSDTFHLSDYFINNTVNRLLDGASPNPDWDIPERLSRLVRILTHEVVVRPDVAETAMHQAYSSSMRSACLSRQVGAALADKSGNIVSTGTNEVPKAGGGVYGEAFDDAGTDDRCAFRESKFCSNTRRQNDMVDTLIDELPELKSLDQIRKYAVRSEIRGGGIGDLLEFSRAVHAEMDALLSAGRVGVSTVGTRLFVTTFPCHYCARHIVSAGVDEVQYIEPYPKSQALKLHRDAIQSTVTGWVAPSEGGTRALFHPFVGVAPRMYRRAFLKTRDLKDPGTGNLALGEPDWGSPWHLRTTGYVELEAALERPDG